jgi:hypothetical protein
MIEKTNENYKTFSFPLDVKIGRLPALCRKSSPGRALAALPKIGDSPAKVSIAGTGRPEL